MVHAPTKKDNLAWLDLGVWPCYLGFCSSQFDYSGFLEEIGMEDEEWMPELADACVKVLVKDRVRTYVINFRIEASRSMSETEVAGLCAHESLHVIQDLKEGIGDMGVEGEAYTLQRITMALMDWERKEQKRAKERASGKNKSKATHKSRRRQDVVLDWEPEEPADTEASGDDQKGQS